MSKLFKVLIYKIITDDADNESECFMGVFYSHASSAGKAFNNICKRNRFYARLGVRYHGEVMEVEK